LPGNLYDYVSYLGYDTMSIDIWVTTFQTIYSAELNIPEDGGWELLRNVGTCIRIYTALYSRRPKSFINSGDVV